MSKKPHLWEISHPYYCELNNYLARPDEATENFDSWDHFIAVYGKTDRDLNLVFRFDWEKPNNDNGLEFDELRLYFISQRKGHYHSVVIKITDKDEKAVIRWLRPSWYKLQELWEPISD